MLEFKNPRQLSDWMKSNIKYKNFDKLMSYKEVLDKKAGSCHDQVQFEKYYFEKFKNNKIIDSYNLLFMIEHNNDDKPGGRTHTLIYYTKDNRYYWFENAWEGHKGINGPFKNVKELKEKIKELMLKDSSYKYIEFSSCNGIKIGMNLSEYVNACLSINESVQEEEKYSLLKYKRVDITPESIKKYKGLNNQLSHIKDNSFGYMYLHKLKLSFLLVAFIACEKKDNGEIWIQALVVNSLYRNKGLGKQLLNVACKQLKATHLSVNKKNTIAINMYKEYGFKVYDESETMYFMKK